MSLKKMLKKSKLFSFTAVLICIGFVLTFLTGCHKDPMDTVWDGNYIYSGIYRCKTNGEDEEVIVDKLSLDGETYEYCGGREYCYIGETFYLGASYKDFYENKRTFVVKYEIKDKTYEIICRDKELEGETYELSQVEYFFVKEDKLYFSALFRKDEICFSAFMGYDPQIDSLNTYFVTDTGNLTSQVGLKCVYDYENYFVFINYYDGNYHSYNKITGESFVLNKNGYYSLLFLNGYLISGNANNEIFIISVENGSEKKIFSFSSEEKLSFQNRDKENGKIYFITEEPTKDEDAYYHIIRSSIYFYDIKTDKLYNLTPRNPFDTKVYSFLGENFFVEEDVYETTRRVTDRYGKSKTIKCFEEKNARIYRFDENGNVKYITNLFPGEKKGYIKEEDDGNIRYLGSGGIGNTDKIFNPETNKTKKVKSVSKTRAEKFMEYGVQCGNLYYIADRGGWFSINAVRRFNKKTKKIVRVQSYSITPSTYVLESAKIDLILPY